MPQGVSDEVVAARMPKLGPLERTACINRLLASKRIQLFQAGSKGLVLYKEVSAEEMAK